MTATRFLCLANSKKYTQRCIAGIVLEPMPTGTGHTIVRHPDGFPRWIRPVARNETGEVAENAVKHIQLLDIVQIEAEEAHPHGHQQENCYFKQERIAVLHSVPPDPAILNKFITPVPAGLFGDGNAAITVESAKTLNHSLLMVKVTDAMPHFASVGDERVQIRLRFGCQGFEYDLPVTDIDFRLRFYKDCFILRGRHHIYCTISLGQAYKGFYYKLVAGVLYC